MEPQKKTEPVTFACPACQKDVAPQHRVMDQVYRCPWCMAYIMQGISRDGIGESKVWDIPSNYTLEPAVVHTTSPILKFMFELVKRVPLRDIEEIMGLVRSSADNWNITGHSVHYSIDLLKRLGVTLL